MKINSGIPHIKATIITDNCVYLNFLNVSTSIGGTVISTYGRSVDSIIADMEFHVSRMRKRIIKRFENIFFSVSGDVYKLLTTKQEEEHCCAEINALLREKGGGIYSAGETGDSLIDYFEKDKTSKETEFVLEIVDVYEEWNSRYPE